MQLGGEMKNTKPISLEEISDEWGTYLVKAHLSEEVGAKNGCQWPVLSDVDIERYTENISIDFESQIYLRPTPIWIDTTQVRDILTVQSNGKRIRIYPPFEVNEKGETSGAFEGVQIPEGEDIVDNSVELHSSAVRGVRMEHGNSETLKWCRGVRIDFEIGADVTSTLNLFWEHLCQYTHQWWIRASHNPMLGPLRMGGAITKDHKIVRELRCRGAGEVESSWYGAVQYQPHLGFGSPLTRGGWLLAAQHTHDQRNPDQGLISFYDGMADYMAGHYEKAILNLCIATEIMLSKHSFAILKRSPTNLPKAIRTTMLVEGPVREVLKELLIDRNQVAHGSKIRNYDANGKPEVKKYLQAVSHLVSAYLNSMPQGEWPDIMGLKLDKSEIIKKQRNV